MIETIMIRIKNFIKSPHMTLFTGMMLLVVGIFEITETALENNIGHDIRITHALFILAAQHILVSMVHIIEGVKKINVYVEEE